MSSNKSNSNNKHSNSNSSSCSSTSEETKAEIIYFYGHHKNAKYGLVCPILNQVADPSLTPEMAVQKSCDKYDIKSSKDNHYQIQLTDAMIDGIGIHLHGNLFDISGFPQWYPFGIGDMKKEDR